MRRDPRDLTHELHSEHPSESRFRPPVGRGDSVSVICAGTSAAQANAAPPRERSKGEKNEKKKKRVGNTRGGEISLSRGNLGTP